MRLFAALPLTPELHQGIATVIRSLQERLPAKGLRWTPPENLHLTLKFIGETPEEVLPEINAACQEACLSCPPMTLTLAGLGAFPPSRFPKVLWIGIQGDLEPLHFLQARLERAMERWAPPEPRDFAPHLTLARCKFPSPKLARAWRSLPADIQNVSVGSWKANRVAIMQSRLSSTGATYSVLAAQLLAGTNP